MLGSQGEGVIDAPVEHCGMIFSHSRLQTEWCSPTIEEALLQLNPMISLIFSYNLVEGFLHLLKDAFSICVN